MAEGVPVVQERESAMVEGVPVVRERESAMAEGVPVVRERESAMAEGVSVAHTRTHIRTHTYPAQPLYPFIALPSPPFPALLSFPALPQGSVQVITSEARTRLNTRYFCQEVSTLKKIRHESIQLFMGMTLDMDGGRLGLVMR